MRKKVLALLLSSFCVVSGIAMTDCADALQKNQAESRIEGIKGFYNTVHNIDGKEQATETKVELENMTYEVVPLLYGDVDNNGKVDFADVLCLKRHVAKWSGYENINTELANLNHDDSIDEKDILILERYVAGWKNYETSSE